MNLHIFLSLLIVSAVSMVSGLRIVTKTMSGSGGTIKSPGYPNNYPANVEYTYHLSVRSGYKLKLTFSDFSLENNPSCSYDKVVINGQDYCGETIPSPVTSTSNSLTVKFISDGAITEKGFKATFEEISDTAKPKPKPKPSCGGKFTGLSGTITSPGYPLNDYPNYASCGYHIQVPATKTVSLSFSKFGLESPCNYDSVQIFDGPDKTSTKIGSSLCGSSLPDTVTSTGRNMFVLFTSDSATTDVGFVATYTAVSDTAKPKPSCGGKFTGLSGTITSPGYPLNDYPNDASCGYHIQVSATKTVSLSFSKFGLESPCNYDSVQIFDGPDKTSTKIGSSLCGSSIPDTVKSTGRNMFVLFTSDTSTTDKGFVATYTAVSSSGNSGNGNNGNGNNGQTCGISDAQPVYGIVGGHDTSITKHPWQVLLISKCRNRRCSQCGGSIIGAKWVITAAHCTYGIAGAWDIKVYAGTNDAGNRPHEYKVKRVIDHHGYRDESVKDDIALIEIDDTFDLSKPEMRAICLATENDGTTFDNTQCIATGWGRISTTGPTTTILQEVDVNVADRAKCDKYGRRGYLRDTHMCAGDLAGGKGTCMGDSGGPLACKRTDGAWVLAGLTSFGEKKGCALKGKYGYFSRISYYREWIRTNTSI